MVFVGLCAIWRNGSSSLGYRWLKQPIYTRCRALQLVAKAMANNVWVTHINMQDGLSIVLIQQFYDLWSQTQTVQLTPGTKDGIRWKFTADGCYSVATAYSMQFAGLIKSAMPQMVWKIWAPPKIKFFSWLVLQDRIWTAELWSLPAMQKGTENGVAYHVQVPLHCQGVELDFWLVGLAIGDPILERPSDGEPMVDFERGSTELLTEGDQLFANAHLPGDLERKEC